MEAASLPFRPRDRAAYLPEADALVLADLHLGRGEDTGLELPITGRVPERVADLLDWCAPSTVVLAGDVVHSFAGPSGPVEAAFDTLADAVDTAGADLAVLSGNHDGALSSLADAEPSLTLPDGTLVCHGHELPETPADRYVIGHDHPAVTIEGQRRPCYLYAEGVFRDADVLVLPAFSPLATGTLVNDLERYDASSPFIVNVGAFHPVVRDDAVAETYVFPPLSASGAHL